MAHVVNVPSNPPGWSAGKWGEWYPDLLGSDGKLSVAKPKPYWQSGWLAQHDRLMQSLAGMPERIPLVVSGDLHDIAEGYMRRSGRLDFSAKPVVTVLPGSLGTSTGGWPSEFRGVGALPPNHLDMDGALKPLEEWIPDDGLHARGRDAALLPLKSEDAVGRSHRHARTVSHDRTVPRVIRHLGDGVHERMHLS